MRPKLLAVIILMTGLMSCKKGPKACIEMDKTTAAVGETITFTSCSEKALSFIWRFEGPSGAPENDLGWSDEMIQVAFSVPGTYTVTLEAYYKYSFLGEMDATSDSFTVQ